MADTFKFELVSPERLLVSETVSEVVIPATDGEMTVLANHAPVMTTIKPGIVTLKTASGESHKYVVFGGFADILPTGCTLLAESAVSADDMSPDDLQKRIATARSEIEEGNHHHDHLTKLEKHLYELTNLHEVLVAA
ncbi:MAG: F0F1 ATP synthase subunit epsilon [Agrobacterium cavarae]|jgi:F-type H+-transporting ATPase subunit epsilon|uniref:ATP synthase epsilon chain n=1 Tax=Rhizobium rhizogenes TaxID=359 RepID=A0AA92C279_RHIRH|nr:MULTISPECIES: F0F1 ATP synthase subunit epsilon [Rhizobium/Agrobacterium group]PVE53242.1 F0F1 ATP synthase subunit epsilon [Rhizobium rhizogenes]PVE63327.1 F0F1 ATP synthase subunit epsilon [Agrobacterium tumefaciens]PVE72218.1 F0F1 ATP synthase subunit epsilon [Sphingomonas sp. TPD3009]